MEDRVLFWWPMAGADLARSKGAADVLVLPSRSETYGMVVTEALARGLPVVAAEVGGVPEALGHGADGARPGVLVPPDDAAALGEALCAWLEDPGLRRRLRLAPRERRARRGARRSRGCRPSPAWGGTGSGARVSSPPRPCSICSRRMRRLRSSTPAPARGARCCSLSPSPVACNCCRLTRSTIEWRLRST